MIEVRCKGLPMKDGTPIDAEGFHHFNLDETKHDPFTVIERLEAKAAELYGAQPRDEERDARWRKLAAVHRQRG